MQDGTTLGEAEADKAVAAIRDELRRRGMTAVIAVADPHGELIALLRLDGAPLSSVQVAANKAWTAARQRRPTRDTGAALRDPASGFDIAWYGDPRYTGFAGGLPVLVGGRVVGAVAVSGLTQALDDELAAIGVAAIAGPG
jgi:glc operon protein GlcG